MSLSFLLNYTPTTEIYTLSLHDALPIYAGEARLGDGRIDYTLRPELLQQALGHLVGALVQADLLPDHEDAGITLHLFAQSEVERLAIGHHRHPSVLLVDVGEEPCDRRPRGGVGD